MIRIKAYHGSIDKFDRIDLSKTYDIGFHCGTYEQAMRRIFNLHGKKWNKNKFIYLVDVEINENEILDIGEDIFLCGFYSNCRILCDLLNERCSRIRFRRNKFYSYYDIRCKLRKNGIRVLSYDNDVEGKGKSYIILDDTIPITEINHLN